MCAQDSQATASTRIMLFVALSYLYHVLFHVEFVIIDVLLIYARREIPMDVYYFGMAMLFALPVYAIPATLFVIYRDEDMFFKLFFSNFSAVALSSILGDVLWFFITRYPMEKCTWARVIHLPFGGVLLAWYLWALALAVLSQVYAIFGVKYKRFTRCVFVIGTIICMVSIAFVKEFIRVLHGGSPIEEILKFVMMLLAHQP